MLVCSSSVLSTLQTWDSLSPWVLRVGGRCAFPHHGISLSSRAGWEAWRCDGEMGHEIGQGDGEHHGLNLPWECLELPVPTTPGSGGLSPAPRQPS